MIRWLWKIIVGKPTCTRECQWEPYAEAQYGYTRQDGQERIQATVYVLRCKTCGDMNNHRVTG